MCNVTWFAEGSYSIDIFLVISEHVHILYQNESYRRHVSRYVSHCAVRISLHLYILSLEASGFNHDT